jgi:hypothetical protein
VFYSVPAWGKQVPLLGLFAVLLILGLVAGKQASLTTAMIAGLLLVLGYSPDSSAESASSAHASGSSSSSGLSVRFGIDVLFLRGAW